MATDTEKRTIGAVEKTFDILETLLKTEKATLQELDEQLEYSKTSIYNHLQTLKAREYIVKDGQQYHPSLYFLRIGERVRRKYNDVYRYGAEEIKNLAEETGEVGWLAVEERNRSVFVGKHRGPKAVETGRFPLGRPLPLHCTGGGKAILSQYSDERVSEIIDDTGLDSLAPNTITSREELFEELEECRENGYAIESEEVVSNICGVASPITMPNGVVVGAISITGPVSRMKGDRLHRELPEKVVEYANLIEIKLMRDNTDEFWEESIYKRN